MTSLLDPIFQTLEKKKKTLIYPLEEEVSPSLVPKTYEMSDQVEDHWVYKIFNAYDPSSSYWNRSGKILIVGMTSNHQIQDFHGFCMSYFFIMLEKKKPKNSCMHPMRSRVRQQSNLGFLTHLTHTFPIMVLRRANVIIIKEVVMLTWLYYEPCYNYLEQRDITRS